jgi:hypothetical protein
MSTPSSQGFEPVFARLKSILQKYERGGLRANPDEPGYYALTGPAGELSRGRELWVAAVRTGKNYVSFHLMPVYGFPDLLDDISPALKKRMQGKSCFNFKSVDEPLFSELAGLTERGFRRFRQAGILGK